MDILPCGEHEAPGSRRGAVHCAAPYINPVPPSHLLLAVALETNPRRTQVGNAAVHLFGKQETCDR